MIPLEHIISPTMYLFPFSCPELSLDAITPMHTNTYTHLTNNAHAQSTYLHTC